MKQYVGKIVTPFVLLASLIFMVREVLKTYQSSLEGTIPPVEKKEKKTGLKQWSQKIRFNPIVPSPLPDLYDGYLFNKERYLAEQDEEGKKETAEKDVEVDLDVVMYTGSIISGTVIKGIITYPEPQQAKTKSRTSRSWKRKKTKLSRSKKRVTRIVEPGDVVGGYQISAIEAERIVFAKNKEQVEKKLYDPEKKRIVVPKPSPKPRKTVKRKATVSKRKRITSPRKPVKSRKVFRSRK